MSYIFRYSFVRTVEHEDFGGYETSEELRSDWFYFNDFEQLASNFVSAVLDAASADLVGRGVRVYNFLELLGLVRISFNTFVEDASQTLSSRLSDQTSDFVPTASVKSVVLYYSFDSSSVE